MHKGEHAHRKEPDSVKREERSDDVLAGVDVFEQTEDAIDANDEFEERHPRELLCVMANGLFLGVTALRGADEATLGAKHGGENGAGVAHCDAHAESHQDGQREQTDLPTGIARATLGDKVKNGRCDCREEDKGETDSVSPGGEMRDRFKESEERPGAKCGKQHAGVNRVVRRMEDGSNLHAERNLGTQNLRQNLNRSLDGTLCPTELLRLECVDVVREFCRNNHVEHELHLPTGKLGPVRKVHVFGQRVAFPTATAIDGFLAPDACGTVEVHEQLAPATCGLFHHEVTIDADGLGERKTGFSAVQVAPATLYEPDLRVHDEVRNRLEEEVFLRDEVCVEDGEEFTLGDFHAFFEGACLEVLAVRAVDELDVITAGGEFCNFLLGDFVTFVGRVVQNLNFVLVLRIVDCTDSFEETFNAVGFIKDRELGRDLREVGHGMFAIELQDSLAVRESCATTVLEE